MKKLILLFCFVMTVKLNAQTVTTYSTFCHQMDRAPFSFLDDLVPTAKDCVLVVNLNIVKYIPTGGGGFWDNLPLNSSNIGTMITDINWDWNNILPPDAAIANTPWITRTRIQFQIKSFSTVTNTAIYNDVRTVTTTAAYDTAAINIFFGSCIQLGTYSICAARVPPPLPSNIIYALPSNNDPFYIQTRIISHELGHSLGLHHAIVGDSISRVSPPGSCCPNIYARDYQLNPGGQVDSCGHPGSVNNIMSNNFQCRRYFSPRQMAIMHYNLRTKLQHALTPASYTYALQTNTAFNYTVTGNELWIADRYMKGNIIIQPGAKLSVGCLVAMSRHGKIIVKKKGQLESEGTITNISGKVWKGIQVEGNPNLPQVLGSDGFSTEQGIVWLYYNAVISQALVGVRNHSTDDNYGTSGGMIQGLECTFKNNVKDVDMITYTSNLSQSNFILCNFLTTGQINETGIPDAHVTIYNSKGTKFYGCKFEYSAGSTYSYFSRGDGIRTYAAGYSVNSYNGNPSIFKKLTNGIRAGSGGSNNIVTIANSRFIDNSIDGVNLHNIHGVIFQDNYLRMPCVQPMGNGLYLNECKYYTVKNNLFEDSCGGVGIGMYARLSKEGAHQVYRNVFKNLYAGIDAVENNSGLSNVTDGLKMNCNDFSQGYVAYNIMVAGAGTGTDSPSVMKTQGAINGVVTATNLVRNIYNNFTGCGSQTKWYTSGNSTKIVEHGTNLGADTKPLPAGCSNTSIVNVVASNIALNYTLHCPPYLPSNGDVSGPADRISRINTFISEQQNLTSGQDVFALQAAMAAKLEWFITDTIHPDDSQDSVLAVLASNPGNMGDVDLQRIFAYMTKGDYTHAENYANALTTNRADWKTLLLKLIDIQQEPDQLNSITTNTAYRSFLDGYANTDGKQGQGVAQAILHYFCNEIYDEPRPLPEEEGARPAHAAASGANMPELPTRENVWVFPNPFQSEITVKYQSEEEGSVLLELKDLLGRIIYTNFISEPIEELVSLKNFSNGVYILTVSRDGQPIYKTKLIKQE